MYVRVFIIRRLCRIFVFVFLIFLVCVGFEFVFFFREEFEFGYSLGRVEGLCFVY